MPGKHFNNPTISFRPSQWAKGLIEERARLSGLYKKDFITRCCVYSNIVVVGTPENIHLIIDAVQDAQVTIKEIAEQLRSGKLDLSKSSFHEMRCEILAIAVTVVDIIDGAAYMFNKSPPEKQRNWKMELEIEELREALKNELPPTI